MMIGYLDPWGRSMGSSSRNYIEVPQPSMGTLIERTRKTDADLEKHPYDGFRI